MFTPIPKLCLFKWRIAIVAALVLTAGLMAMPQPVMAADACSIIEREGRKMLTGGISRGKISGVVSRRVSVSSWARSSLGSSYNRLSKSEQSQYRKAFRNYLVSKAHSFARRYPGRAFKVVRRNCNGSGRIQAKYTRRSGAVNSIFWSVSQSGGKVWISDVRVGGFSLRGSIRSELRGAYANGGFSGLMAKMR